MRRLHRPSLKKLYDPYLKWVWRAVFLTTIGLGLLGRCFFGWLLEGKSCVPPEDVLNSLLTIGPWALLFLLVFGGLTRLARRDYLRGKFDLLVPAKEFRPEDLRFQVLNPGERADLRQRPFYPGYISRTAVEKDKDDAYDEEDLAEKIIKGEGFVLFGEPLSGKSRTLYEVVRRIGERTKDCEVLVPPKKEVPDDEAFSILKRRRVILLLEDLNHYMGQGTPLREYVDKLENHGVLRWVVASTCEDGPAMTAIRASEGSALGNFYRDDIPLKLNLR